MSEQMVAIYFIDSQYILPMIIQANFLLEYSCVSVHENTTTGIKCPWEQEGWFHWWILEGGIFFLYVLNILHDAPTKWVRFNDIHINFNP